VTAGRLAGGESRGPELLPSQVFSTRCCATLRRGAGPRGRSGGGCGEGRGLVVAPRRRGSGAGGGTARSPPLPAAATGCGPGAGAGAAIGAAVARHGGAGGRRRSAALGTDLLTHISRRGHGARGPGATARLPRRALAAARRGPGGPTHPRSPAPPAGLRTPFLLLAAPVRRPENRNTVSAPPTAGRGPCACCPPAPGERGRRAWGAGRGRAGGARGWPAAASVCGAFIT
jgi:hypothetical protein